MELFTIEDGVPFLLGAECCNCHYSWFPRILLGCERCGAYGDRLKPRSFSTRGKLISSARINQGSDGNFTLANIVLDEGPIIRAILDDESPVEIDDPVSASIIEEDDSITVRFRKA